MGSLLEWFRIRREVGIIKATRTHAKKVYDCTFELNNLIRIFFEGKTQELPNLIKKVHDLENEADTIRRQIMLDLTKGELTADIREDLGNLIIRLDQVANNANATAKRVSLLTPEVLTPIAEDIQKMSKLTLNCIEILQKTIDKQLGETYQTIFESVSQIKRLEHEIDVINYQIKEKLAKIKPDYSSYIALLTFELINSLENISDFAEETADFIKLINVRHG